MTGSMRVVLGCGLIGLALPVQAARIDERYWLQVAAFKPSIDTTAQFSLPRLPTNGTEVNFENDLGLADSEWLPLVEVGLRLGNRWRIEGEYYRLSRSGSKLLVRDIVWDDVTYRAGARAEGEFSTSIYRAAIGYSLVKNPQFELGASIGAHLTDFTASISGQALVNDTEFTLRRQQTNQFVPLPTIGAYAAYDLNKTWSLQARLDWLSLTVGDYNGGVTDFWVTANARVWKHVGLGAGWRYVNYHLGANKDDWEGYLRYKFNGPTFFINVGF